MKSIKRITAIICLSAMMVCCFSFSASALVFVEGDFGYDLNSYTREMTVVSYSGSGSVVTIPGSYGDYPVTKLSKTALSGNADMQVLNFPTTLRKIDNGSLSDCSALSLIRFPTFITSIGSEVCANCTALQTAYVYSFIEELPDYSFVGCSSLSTVDLNNSITSIGNYAFQDCAMLKNIGFLSNISSIGRHSFEGTGIEQLTIPDSIEVIPEYAFANCSNLTDVTIPDNVTDISQNAFYNDNITIHCYYNSYAHTYAKENNIPYVFLDDVLQGDVNLDGTVDINDATLLQKYCALLVDLNELQLSVADINNFGRIDIRCVTAIQRYIAR